MMQRAAILLSLFAVATTEPVDTCATQSKYVRITVEPAYPGGDVPDCPGDCDQYKVCLTLLGLNAGQTISHTCTKPPSMCPVGDFDMYKDFTYGGSVKFGYATGPGTPAANNVTQCQYGLAGATLYFLLKDGSKCQDGADYVTYGLPIGSDPNPVATAECRSRAGWKNTGKLIKSCTGNSEPKECVWAVTLPKNGCGDTPVVPNDIGCDLCAPLTPECRAEVDAQPSNSLYFDITNCGNPQDVVKALAPYGCKQSIVPGCNVITCDSFVPMDAVKDYDTAQCSILR